MSIKMIAIVAIVLVIGGVAYVTRDVLKLVLEAVWNVLKTLWEATWRVATALWNFLVLLRCYLYLARWKVRALWRKRILDTASFVVGSALVWIFLKAALAFLEQLHHDPATGGPSGALVVPDTWPRTRTVVIALATYLDGFLELARAAVHQVVGEPFNMDIIILVLSAMLLGHHVGEWFLKRREMEIPAAAEKLVKTFRATDPSSGQARLGFQKHVLSEFCDVLMKGSRRKVALSLMTLDNTSNELSIRTMSPDKAFEDTLRLKVDPGGDPAKAEGSAGVARTIPSVVYVPSISHKFGFDMKTFHPVKVPFKPPGRREPWRCLLCVPFELSGGTQVVLNISSNKKNTFEPLDFEIGRMVAALCALVD